MEIIAEQFLEPAYDIHVVPMPHLELPVVESAAIAQQQADGGTCYFRCMFVDALSKLPFDVTKNTQHMPLLNFCRELAGVEFIRKEYIISDVVPQCRTPDEIGMHHDGPIVLCRPERFSVLLKNYRLSRAGKDQRTVRVIVHVTTVFHTAR